MNARSGNPTEQRQTKLAMSNTAEGHVIRLFTVDGMPWAEVRHVATPQTWKVPILLAGAGDDQQDYAPMTASPDPTVLGTRVKLLFTDANRNPVLLGCMNKGIKLQQTAKPPEATEDRSDGPALTDRILANGGGALLISGEGEPTITTEAAKGSGVVRMQLKGGAVLRVSRAGAAKGRVLAAEPTESYLSALETYAAALEAKITALAALVSGGPAAVAAIVATRPTVATAKLRAAVLHISDEVEGAS